MSLSKTLSRLSGSNDITTAFGRAMDLAIKSQHAPYVSRPNIKPSKAGCIRQMYYILTESPVSGKDKVNPDMTLIQLEGSAMHRVIQEILSKAKDQGIEFLDPVSEVSIAQQKGIRTQARPSKHDADNPYEVTCYNEDYNVSFKFDGTLRFMNKKVILEIKNEDHFKYLKRTSPDEDHILQAVFYSLCLGIDYVLFMYVDRNYKRRKYYLVEITDEMRQEQVHRIKTAMICRDRGIVPAKTKHKGCNYCAYKSLCKAHGEEGHEDKIPEEDIESYQISQNI